MACFRYAARRGRIAGLARAHVEPVIPSHLFAGPRANVNASRAMAEALAKIAVTFAGAEHLATIQLDDGRWLAVTTH